MRDDDRTRRLPARLEGVTLRWLGLVALALGLLGVWSWFPTRAAPDWDAVRLFSLDQAECAELLDERTTSTLVVVDEPFAPTTIGEVAQSYGLELALVCAANARPADCGEDSFEEGLTLPLYFDPANAR